MNIHVKLAFHEEGAVRLLNWLARENARILRDRPDLPLLYDSGVVYKRERDETWCDVVNTLLHGKEDCDGLAAYRAGELLARGFGALSPGDEGYELAARSAPESIDAEVLLRTKVPHGGTGTYHCVVRYRLDGRWFFDDPSARLGMNGGVDDAIRRRRARRKARRDRSPLKTFRDRPARRTPRTPTWP